MRTRCQRVYDVRITDVLMAVLVAGCDVGTTSAPGPDASTAVPGALTVNVTTSSAGGLYAPANVVAIWLEDGSGTFVQTLGRWSMIRTAHLVAWNMASGGAADAMTGATRTTHATPLSVSGDLTSVPAGTLTVRMELADSSSTQASQNNQGMFTFTKGTAPVMEMGLSNGGFSDVSIQFTP